MLAAPFAACVHATAVVPAVTFAPSSREAFEQAASVTRPAQRQVVRISWRSDDGHLQLAGRGAVRIAPPDSLRADIAASLGVARSTLVMTGDAVAARPAEFVDQLLPDRFALWAVLGIIRVPTGSLLVEHAEAGARNLWRTTDADGRITTFELNRGALVSVKREQGGRTTSQLRLTHGAGGDVRRASLTDLAHGLRLEVNISGREPSDAFASEIWQIRP